MLSAKRKSDDIYIIFALMLTEFQIPKNEQVINNK